MNDRMLNRRMLSVTPSLGSRRRVGRQHRDALAHHAPHDHPAERRVRRHRSVALPQHARRQRLVRRIAQHQKRALGRHRLERDVDDALEDVGERLAADERPADVGEQLDEMPVGAAGSGRRLCDGHDWLDDRPRPFGDLVALR